MNYKIEPVNNETFDNADPETRRTIVLLGVNTYINIPRHELVVVPNENKMLNQKQEIIDQMERENQMLRSIQNKRINEAVEEERTRTGIVHSKELDRLQAQIQSFVDAQRTFYADRDEYANQFADRCMKDLKAQLETERAYSSTLKQLNDKYEDKRVYENNTAKGDDGEDMIETFLSAVPNLIITNTAKTPNCTDFRCTYGSHEFLIESKYVVKVKKETVDKFVRDVKVNANSIHGAVFVSITDGVRIPKKHTFDYELVDGVPCVYITSFETNKQTLLAALQWLELYNRNITGNLVSKTVTDMLYGVLDEWKHHFEALSKHKRAVRVIYEDVTRMESNVSLTIANTTARIESVIQEARKQEHIPEDATEDKHMEYDTDQPITTGLTMLRREFKDDPWNTYLATYMSS